MRNENLTAPALSRLERDYREEAAYMAAHPDDDNVRILHCRRHLSQCGMYYDRGGRICYIYYTHSKHPRWQQKKIIQHQCPAMKAESRPAYKRVFYEADSKMMGILLHREIADLYLPNTDFTKTQIDHINGDHNDNRAENLERVTPEENIRRRWVMYWNLKNRKSAEDNKITDDGRNVDERWTERQK